MESVSAKKIETEVKGGLQMGVSMKFTDLDQYLFGQGTEIIHYAHEILIKPTVLALVEKNGIWYAVDYNGRLTKQFSWQPCIQSEQK